MSVLENYVKAFQAEVLKQPRATAMDLADMDTCSMCSTHKANIKIERRCLSEGAPAAEGNNSEQCVICHWKPMSCSNCIAIW